MNSLIARINTALRQRAEYSRTRRELRDLPIDTQLDLGIYSDDAPRIARRAVYGL